MIDFFEGETEINSEFFGICDNPDTGVKTPAYIDSDIGNENKWIAVVNNHSKAPVYFNPIDNNIEIKREDGEMENRCDALLHNNYWIAFIELKAQRRNWIKRAVEEQLVPTINVFKQNHDISRFKHRYAYACNRLKPKFSYSHKIEMQEFYDIHGVRLVIGGNCPSMTARAACRRPRNRRFPERRSKP